MIRIHVPGIGFGLRVCATTNGQTWHPGVVDPASRSVELATGEVLTAGAIHRVRHDGAGTWVHPHEARAIVLLLSMIGGVEHRQLLDMAWEGTEPEDPPAPQRRPGRPRKQLLSGDGGWPEIPVGLTPVAAVPQARLALDDSHLPEG